MKHILLLLTGLLLAPLAALHAADVQKPNILFLFADDWGWPHASCLGDPVVKTPTFDRLAREGVLFRNAHSASPSCSPSCAVDTLTREANEILTTASEKNHPLAQLTLRFLKGEDATSKSPRS